MPSTLEPFGEDDDNEEDGPDFEALDKTFTDFLEAAGSDLGLYLASMPEVRGSSGSKEMVGQFVFRLGDRAYKTDSAESVEEKRLLDRFELDLIEEEVRGRLAKEGDEDASSS